MAGCYNHSSPSHFSFVVPLKRTCLRQKVEATSYESLVTAEFENNKKAVDQANNIDTPKKEEIANPISIKIARRKLLHCCTGERQIYDK